MRLIHCFWFSAGFFLLSSCASGDEVPAPEEDKQEQVDMSVSFGVDITGYASRVSQNGGAWTSNDRIGAYMLDAGTGIPADTAMNIPYVCSEGGATAVFTSETPLAFPADGTVVKFAAYYPYSSVIQNSGLSVNIADQSKGTAAYDLMYASGEGAYEEGGQNRVPLTFTHQLTKILIEFVDSETGMILAADRNVTLLGMDVEANFNVLTSELDITEGSEAEIVSCYNAAAGSYEAVVFPVSVTDVCKAVAVIDGNLYEWTFTDTDIKLPALEKGYRYVFSIPVDTEKGEVSGPAKVETVSGGNTSYPWNNDEDPIVGNATGIINYSLCPARGEEMLADAELSISFNNGVPELGEGGFIYIRKVNDNKLVDVIDLSERQEGIVDGVTRLNTWMDIVGATESKRVVNYHPVYVEGGKLYIKPHSHTLDYDTEYYVTIDRQAISHPDFDGIYTKSWTFRTKEEPQLADNTAYVSHTASDADFYTLQGAVDWFYDKVDHGTEKTIRLDNGVYKEIIYIRDQNNITVKGTGRELVSIQYDNRNELNGGIGEGTDMEPFTPEMVGVTPVSSGNRSVMTIGGSADKIRFEDVTIENTSGDRGQAEAIVLRSEGATAFVRCDFHGYQDTVLGGGGYNWFYQCLVTGATDFIWGGPKVSLFEECEIRASQGRALNARVGEGNLGYVFLNTDFTVDGSVGESTSLIEPSTGDHMTFLNCTFADAFIAGGIPSDLNNEETPSATTGTKMYNCKDKNGDDAWEQFENHNLVHPLTQEEYNQYYGNRDLIMKGYSDVNWFVDERTE